MGVRTERENAGPQVGGGFPLLVLVPIMMPAFVLPVQTIPGM